VPGRLDDPIEFSPHFIFAHHFGIETAETALRAQGQLFQRKVARGLINAPLEFIERLHIGTLGRDQTQNDGLILRHESQGLKTAGSFAVVFEQQSLMFETIEQPLGDGVIVTFTVPLRNELAGFRVDGAGIATTNMDTEGYASGSLR